MKVRIGVGMGVAAAASANADAFIATVQHMERLRFDSLWLSEVLTTPTIDPLAGLAFTAGVTRKLKLGTTLTVTARNPVRLAKELATTDRLSNGRLLLVFVPGLTNPIEDQALGMPVRERGAWIDESLPLVRALWSDDNVEHHGQRFTYVGPAVQPRPVQDPLEVWLGGNAPSALRRAGHLSDGWLPSLCTPAEAAAGKSAIDAAAADVGRSIDPEHFGISLSYALGNLSTAQIDRIRKRRPNLDPSAVMPNSYTALRELLCRYVDVGFSKFVIRPADTPGSWTDELERLANAVLDLQT
ncbi:MAG: TIGR03854 family LLM class F420-dependent oxidoreductase [Chloroflexota bacterium]